MENIKDLVGCDSGTLAREAVKILLERKGIDVKLSERGRAALRTEGKRGNGWILVDFGDVIINVFDRASRDFYNLDRHFDEECLVDITDLVKEVDAKFDINKN